MSDQSEIPIVDAVEAFVASLRQRSVPVNTIKSYAHDLQLFVRFAPNDLPAVGTKTIQEFLAIFSHLSDAHADGATALSAPSTTGSFAMEWSRRI